MTIRAVRAAAASGPVSVAFTATAKGRSRTIRKHRRPGAGRLQGLPAAPRRPARRAAGKLVVRYGGDSRYLPGTADRRLTR